MPWRSDESDETVIEILPVCSGIEKQKSKL
jgi:hypothetical protein